ncbi:MAG: TIGR01210 family radical SAM protein [Candidatus Nealsonbacteria bacterium]|nr:MAG: TIGR01210 family radical SAM protein [Candidatus Nealsonbacteria bacterium]
MIAGMYYTIKGLKKIVGGKIAQNILSKIAKERFFYTEKVFSPDTQDTITRLVILLPGKGCWWAKQKGGGCTMCGFAEKLKEIRSYQYSAQDLVILCKIALELCEESPVEIAIFNGGSFLNDNEIPLKAQEKIASLAARLPIQTLYVESRPEFVTTDKIRKLVGILKEKKLKVGIGLEAVTDVIRERNINKGFTLKEYERAVEALLSKNAEVLTYVFLKPVKVSERKAIQEAVKTIRYAFKKGSKEVALEAALVQEGTVMAKLFHQGKYRPPWLWSVIEVIKRTYKLGFVHVGNFDDEPSPIAIPFNCHRCTPKVLSALQAYRETHSLESLKYLRCSCKTKWKKEVFQKQKARLLI